MNCTTFASLYGATAQSGTGCSAVGSAPGLGPGGRPFESGHPDNKAKGRSKRNLQKGLAKRNKRCTFAAQLRNGALDEWLSQRSAKPSTAVRIRQAPPLKGKAIEKDTPTRGVFFVMSKGEMTACLEECSMLPENCPPKSILGYLAMYPRINEQISKDTLPSNLASCHAASPNLVPTLT